MEISHFENSISIQWIDVSEIKSWNLDWRAFDLLIGAVFVEMLVAFRKDIVDWNVCVFSLGRRQLIEMCAFSTFLVVWDCSEVGERLCPHVVGLKFDGGLWWKDVCWNEVDREFSWLLGRKRTCDKCVVLRVELAVVALCSYILLAHQLHFAIVWAYYMLNFLLCIMRFSPFHHQIKVSWENWKTGGWKTR